MSESTTKPRPFITLADLFHVDPYIHVPEPEEPGEAAPYIIYVLQERCTGRCYVGLTSRTLALRITAHLSQARRNKPVRSGGLMEALRQILDRGQAFADHFDARIVARAADVETARTLERRWVAMLRSAKPEGYNDMPGGSSVGGPDNARRLAVRTEPGRRQIYRSIHEAIADRNRWLRRAGQAILQPGTVYARLAGGWSPEEALGYVPREDGRSLRALFRLDGVAYTTLASAADASGDTVAALRSRLHRAKQDDGLAGTVIEIGTDRRSCPAASCNLAIPWPATGEALTADAFAARTGVAKSTIIHRWHQVRRQLATGCERLSPTALYDRLTTKTDRRKLLRLVLPDGRVWSGGERELARRVLDDVALEAARPCRLSESGIRRRLRVLTLRERADPALVAAAFGFAPAPTALGA
jgi:hypothetical protein